MHLARGILQPGLASIIDSRILVSKELHLDQVVAAATSVFEYSIHLKESEIRSPILTMEMPSHWQRLFSGVDVL